ncbi:MAG: hypothetical protein NT154_25115, partial [Verrucomicrobia bacterium]|nr:hypothetical protein [Verrucomicrobiota bacterium]
MRSILPTRPALFCGTVFFASRRICTIAGIILCTALAVLGQPTATNSVSTIAELVSQINIRLAEARADLIAAAAVSAGPANLPPGALATEAEEYHLGAESLVRLYQEHLDLANRLEEVQRRLKEHEQKAKVWASFAEPGPYSILFVDELR